MTPVLLTGPAIEPVTLTEMKTYLRVDTSDDDGLINAFITAARLLVEASARRVLISQTWRMVFDAWPVDGVIVLPIAPLIQVSAARVYSASGTATTIPLTSLVADSVSDPPRVRITGPVMVPGRGWQGVEVDVICGYGPALTHIPEPFRQAIRMLVARWYENRGDLMTGDASALPADILALLSAYRRIRV